MTGYHRYRLLALDVDGTIATKDYSVPGPIKTAIRDAVNAGVVVSLVTGRMRRSALRYAIECGTNGPTVSYQGAVITAPDHVTDIHTELLDGGVACDALALMRHAGAHINLYQDDEIWVEKKNGWASGYAERMQTELRLVDSLDGPAANGPAVIMAVDEPDRMASLSGLLREAMEGKAAVTRSLPHFCEVASLRATKEAGLQRVCDDYGIDASEVIAVGDGEGDVSMLRWAGLGVVAGEAHAGAAAAADLRINGPEQCGVAGLVHTLLSQGKLGG